MHKHIWALTAYHMANSIQLHNCMRICISTDRDACRAILLVKFIIVLRIVLGLPSSQYQYSLLTLNASIITRWLYINGKHVHHLVVGSQLAGPLPALTTTTRVQEEVLLDFVEPCDTEGLGCAMLSTTTVLSYNFKPQPALAVSFTSY